MVCKLLTYESWVSHYSWYQYAAEHPELVPLLLVDRSPCSDPFLDPFAPSSGERRPLVSGLCRGLKNFRRGDTFVYVTKIDPRVARALGRAGQEESIYFGVAALEVRKVHCNHEAAANTFTARRFVAAPTASPCPPNLVITDEPTAAVDRRACVVHSPSKKQALPHDPLVREYGYNCPVTPDRSSDALYMRAYSAYRQQVVHKRLRAAECRILCADGREALALDARRAPVLTRDAWGGLQPNTMGRHIPEEIAAALALQIANGYPKA